MYSSTFYHGTHGCVSHGTMRVELVGAGLFAVCATLAWRLRAKRAVARWQDEVLAYWFDGPSDLLYDSKWFVPAGSSAQASLDAEVRMRFGELLVRAERGLLEGWRTNQRGMLALIVLLDQLSRHVHRGDRARVEANDACALRLTQELTSRGMDTALGPAELVFALMPLRHTPTVERLQEVLQRTASCVESCENGARLLSRFRKHTELRLLHLEGKGDPQDILERADREAECDQSGAAHDVLCRCVHAFLLEHGLVAAAQPARCQGQRVPTDAKHTQQSSATGVERHDGHGIGPGTAGAETAPRPPRAGQRQRRNARRLQAERAPHAAATAAVNVDGDSDGGGDGGDGGDGGGDGDGNGTGDTRLPVLVVSLSGGASLRSSPSDRAHPANALSPTRLHPTNDLPPIIDHCVW